MSRASDLIDEISRHHGFGKADIARIIGCSRQHLQNLSQGTANASDEMLGKLQRLLAMAPMREALLKAGPSKLKNAAVPYRTERDSILTGLPDKDLEKELKESGAQLPPNGYKRLQSLNSIIQLAEELKRRMEK